MGLISTKWLRQTSNLRVYPKVNFRKILIIIRVKENEKIDKKKKKVIIQNFLKLYKGEIEVQALTLDEEFVS